MGRRLLSQRYMVGLGIGAAVALLLFVVVPVGAQTPQPRLNEPVFRGQVNSTNATTTLQGSVTGGASLVLDNRATGKPALQLIVTSGAPLTVNSSTRVPLLNADLLDGRHATSFALKNHNHAGIYLPVKGKAANSNRLDGLDSTDFSLAGHDHDATYLAIGGTAADSSLLDGLDSTDFAAAGHTHLFSSLTGIPAGLADGDDDTLAGLACAAGQIPKRNLAGSGWICADDLGADADTLDGLDSTDFSPAGHNHNATYLAIGGTAADSDKVDGLDANDLLRAASAETGDAADGNGAAVTASITAPQAGFLLISGSLEAAGSGDDFGCRLTVDAAAVTASDRNTSLQGLAICSTDGMVPVTAGPHDVALVTFGWDTAAFGNATVWVMFVPFGATG